MPLLGNETRTSPIFHGVYLIYSLCVSCRSIHVLQAFVGSYVVRRETNLCGVRPANDTKIVLIQFSSFL